MDRNGADQSEASLKVKIEGPAADQQAEVFFYRSMVEHINPPDDVSDAGDALCSFQKILKI